MMSLGEQLRFYRKGKNMKQTELKDLAEIDQPYLCRIESGAVVPSVEVYNKIGKALGLRLAFVPAEEEKTEPEIKPETNGGN